MAERYDWDNFPIGQTRCVAHRYRQSVISSFKNFAKARGLDWECSTKSDPSSPKPGQRCNMVWITRIEPRKPKPGIERGEPDAPGITGPAVLKMAGVEFEPPKSSKGRSISMRPIYVDLREIPIKERLALYEARKDRTRLSKRGYERFAVGDYEFVDSRITDIVNQIKNSCLSRGLAWRFEVRRVQNPNDAEDRSVWYLVSRLR